MRGPEEWPSSPGSPGRTEFGLQVRLPTNFLVRLETMFAETQAHALINSWVETIKGVCEILAILVGAAWTYLNYFRGRIYKHRLECSVDASIEKHAGHTFLRAAVRIRNIGLSRVPIEPKGTALLLYSIPAQDQAPSFPSHVEWEEPVAAFDLLAGRKWVESSEAVAEALMVALPRSDASTYKVTLKVVSGEIWWTAESILAHTQ